MKTTLLLILLALNCGAHAQSIGRFFPQSNPIVTVICTIPPEMGTNDPGQVQFILSGFFRTNMPPAFVTFEPDDQSPTNIIISANYQGTVEMDGQSYNCISNTAPVATIAVSKNSNLARKLDNGELETYLRFNSVTNDIDGSFKVVENCGGFRPTFEDVPGNTGFKSRIDAEIARTNYCADFVSKYYKGPKLR